MHMAVKWGVEVFYLHNTDLSGMINQMNTVYIHACRSCCLCLHINASDTSSGNNRDMKLTCQAHQQYHTGYKRWTLHHHHQLSSITITIVKQQACLAWPELCDMYETSVQKTLVSIDVALVLMDVASSLHHVH